MSVLRPDAAGDRRAFSQELTGTPQRVDNSRGAINHGITLPSALGGCVAEASSIGAHRK